MRTPSHPNDSKKVAIVGAGWYGCHIALTLAKQGYAPTVYEKNPHIFGGLSGLVGVLLHDDGLHNLRSEATRKRCQKGADIFRREYPELVNDGTATYGNCVKDADQKQSKVTDEFFRSICRQSQGSHEIEPASAGYSDELSVAFNVNASSLVVGDRLRETFMHRFEAANVTLSLNSQVTSLERQPTSGIRVCYTDLSGSHENNFDYVVNCTSYQYLVNTKIPPPFQMNIVYQACLVLLYEDKSPPLQPHSFTVMDGWNPCWMPYDNRKSADQSPVNKYILYHAKYSILGSYSTPEAAYKQLRSITTEFIENELKPSFEAELGRYWPRFKKNDGRFIYLQWMGAVLAKIKTEKEFRSAITFQDRTTGVIHTIPGKINNISDVAQEATDIIKGNNLITNDVHCYVKGGALDEAYSEITQTISDPKRNTCELQTLEEMQKKRERSVISPMSGTHTTFQQPHKNQQKKKKVSSPKALALSTRAACSKFLTLFHLPPAGTTTGKVTHRRLTKTCSFETLATSNQAPSSPASMLRASVK